MNARSYFAAIQEVIRSAPHVLSFETTFEEIDLQECYIKGRLYLAGGLQLHFAEYVKTEPIIERLKYRYHLQNVEGQLIIRWDNAPHHRQIVTFPHHCHLSNGAIAKSSAVNLEYALKIVVAYL